MSRSWFLQVIDRVIPKRPPTGPRTALQQWKRNILEVENLEDRTLPSIGTNFLGIQISESGFIPPDSMGDVSNTQVLVGANGRIKVFSKTGVLGGLNESLDTFFASVRSAGVSDPHIRFDRLSQRWFVTAIDVAAVNRVLIAASTSSVITGHSSFNYFQFRHDLVGATPNVDTGNFADYDTLGVDRFALYVGVVMFGGAGFYGSTGFVINKANLLAGTLTVTPFRQIGTATTGVDVPQGVNNDDPNATEGYFIGVDRASFTNLTLRRVSNPGSATPTISSTLLVGVPTTTFPQGQPASGSTSPLDALDDRLFAAAIHRDKITNTVSLWTAHNIEVDSTGAGNTAGNRNGSRWYQLGNLTAAPTLIQSGTLFDSAAANPVGYWIPSVAMNGQGHMALGASSASTTTFAGISVSGRLASDPLGFTQPPILAIAGAGSYNLGGNPRRWGDYSQVVVDPSDDMTMWTFQEYANATNSWGVRVIQILAPLPATPTSTNTSVGQGQMNVNVIVTGTSAAGSGFFDPGADVGGPGYTNHISAVVNGGGVTVNSVTFTDPTHITLNLTVSAAAPVGLRTITVTNPDGQSVTSGAILAVAGAVTFNEATGAMFELRRNGTTLELLRNSVVVDSQPIALVASYTLNGANSATDTLLVNLIFGGYFSLPGGVIFNGGSGGSDQLSVIGGTFPTVTHTFTTADAGNILYNNGVDPTLQVNYTGLEQTDTTGATITDLTFTLTAGADDAFLEDDGTPGNGLSRGRSNNGSFATTLFRGPNRSFIVNGAAGNDSITAAMLDFNASLTVDGQANTDTVTIATNLALGSATAAGNVNLTAETINLNAAAISTDAGPTSAGGVTLSAGSIFLGANVVIDTDHGSAMDGNVLVTGPTDADSAANNRTLLLRAGGGNVTLGSIGAANPVQSLTVPGANLVALAGVFSRDGGISVTATTTTLNGNLDTTSLATDGPVTLSGNVTLGASVLINSGNGTLNLSSGTLALGSNGLTVSNLSPAVGTITDPITGTATGSLTKNGSGTLILPSNANTYGGGTTVSGGTLLVNNTTGSGTGTGNVIVNNTGTLGGTGTVSGTVTVSNTGHIAPGTSVESLAVGTTTWSGGTALDIEIDGTAGPAIVGGHDQLIVTGAVNLGGATLNLTGAFTPSSATLQSFVIISNDLADAVVGQFAGLPEGAGVMLNGQPLFVTYQGGDGNDVALNTQPIVNGTNGADTLVLTPLATGFQYQLNADPIVTITSDVRFTFHALDGDDYMLVNVNGNALPTDGIFFNGGSQDLTSRPPTSLGDILRVAGIAAGQTATYTPDAVTTGNGTVTVSPAGTITFTGLEPVDITGMATARITTPSGGANDVLTLANGLDAAFGTTPALIVTGTTAGVAIESAHFFGNTSVVIDTTLTDGNDTIAVASADNAHANTNLTISTGAGVDNVTFSGNTTFTGNVNVSSQTIALTGGTLTAGSIDLAALGDISVTTQLTTTTGAANLTADSDGSGSGGVRVTGAAQVLAATNVTIRGSDIVATAGAPDSVRIDADGANNQVQAGGNILIENNPAAAAGADTFLDGRVTSTGVGGDVTVRAADTIFLATTVTSNGGDILFDDRVIMTANSTVTSSSAGTIAFNGTVNGGFNFSLTTGAAAVTLNGSVGQTTALTSLTVTNPGGQTNLNGGAVTTTGDQTCNGPVVLDAAANATTLTGVNIQFSSTVRGAADGVEALTVSASGQTTFGGAVGDSGRRLLSLTTGSGGTTAINGGSVNTTGGQTYSDAVTLGANTTLTGLLVRLQSGLTGSGFNLSIGGNAELGDATGIDSVTGVNVLTITGTTALNTATITTTSHQNYQGDATVEAGTDPTLTTTGGIVTFGSVLNLGAQTLTVNGASGSTLTGTSTFTADLNSPAAFGHAVLTGLVTLAGAGLNLTRGAGFLPLVGAEVILIDNDGTADAVVGTFTGLLEGATLVIGGIPFTISYVGGDGNDVALKVKTPTEVFVDDDWDTYTPGQTITAVEDANIPGLLVFGYNAFNTIQEAIDQVVPTTGLVEVFGGNYTMVNVNKVLDRIRISTNQEIAAHMSVNFGGSVTLDENTMFAMEADGVGNGPANLTFGAAVIAVAGETLTINGGAGTTSTFGGPVTVGSLTTDAGGTTVLNGGAVTTAGAETYNDAVSVGMNDLALNAANVFFGQTVNSFDAVLRGLTVNTAGVTTFTGAVGNLFALASARFNGGGPVNLNGGAVTTGGDQVCTGPVILGQDTSLIAGGAVGFNSTVNSEAGEQNDLTIQANDLAFGNHVGGIAGGELGLLNATTEMALALAVNLTVQDDLSVTVTDAAGPGQDLNVNAGVLRSIAGGVVLNAGDNFMAGTAAVLQAATTVTIRGDFGSADAATGSTITLRAAVLATTAAVHGGDQPDRVEVAPSLATPYVLRGGRPAAPELPGDRLQLLLPAGLAPVLTAIGFAGPGSGVWTFPGTAFQTIRFSEFEDLSNVGSTAVAATQSGGDWVLRLFDTATGRERFSPVPVAPRRYKGSVRMAVADVTGDGIPDAIVTLGPKTRPYVSIYDGVTGEMVRRFLAVSGRYRGGLQVAAADVTGDGRVEIIVVGAQRERGKVKVFDAEGNLLHEFRVAGVNAAGFSVAAGNVDGRGKAEIILGELIGRNVHVVTGEGVGMFEFTASNSSRVGVTVGVGDVDGDGMADIYTGPNATPDSLGLGLVNSTVARRRSPFRVFNGRNGELLVELLPSGLSRRDSRWGLPFSSVDQDDNGMAELLIGARPGSPGMARVLALLPSGEEVLHLLMDPDRANKGVFVAASQRHGP